MVHVSPSGSTSAGLIARVRSQDSRAWEQCVDLYGPMIYGWCRRSGLSAEDSADISQEVFRSVWRGLDSFQKQNPQDSFRAWLRTITLNQIRDFARKKQAGKAVGGSDAVTQIQQIPAEDSRALDASTGTSGVVGRALDMIRNDFEETTWQAFLLTTLSGYSSREAAERLRLTPNAVRKAKARVLHRLRQEIGDCI